MCVSQNIFWQKTYLPKVNMTGRHKWNTWMLCYHTSRVFLKNVMCVKTNMSAAKNKNVVFWQTRVNPKTRYGCLDKNGLTLYIKWVSCAKTYWWKSKKDVFAQTHFHANSLLLYFDKRVVTPKKDLCVWSNTRVPKTRKGWFETMLSRYPRRISAFWRETVLCLVCRVWCQVSCVMSLVSCVKCLVSCVLCVVSPVLCLVSPVLCIMSCVLCVVSQVMCLVICVLCRGAGVLCLVSWVLCPVF